jgi:signal transduction histidine kinase
MPHGKYRNTARPAGLLFLLGFMSEQCQHAILQLIRFPDKARIMDKTLLEIPTALLQAAKLTPEQARAELAIRLYQQHKLTSQQAAELAGDARLFPTQAWLNDQTGRLDLDDFLDWASHDLKTPLNAVIGFTKVVLKGIDGPINEVQATDLTTAYNGGQRMLALVSQLVEIARLNNSRITLSLEPRNLTDLLTEFTNRWKTANPAKPLTLDLQLSDPIFAIDPMQVRQIVNHALTFAAVRITEGTLSLSVHDTESGAQVTVESTGAIPADKMEMDSTMLEFIITGLVKLHGGTLSVLEEKADGFRLQLSLPRGGPTV